MVARMRPWNLEGMFGPRAEARANTMRGAAALGAGIGGGLDALGQGIEGRRKEAESKRRFGIEKGFEERRLAVAEGTLAMQREERLEKAGAADGMLDNIMALAERFGVMSQLGVSPSEKEWGDFNAGIDALGGQQAVAGALQARERNGGVLPTQDRDDPLDLEARMQRNVEERTLVDGFIQKVAPMASVKNGERGKRAFVAWNRLLDVKKILAGQELNLKQRYVRATKQGKKDEEDAKAAALLEAKRQASHNYRVMAKEAGFKDSEILAMFTGWLSDPEAKVRDIETSITRERRVDQADTRIGNTEKQRGATNAQGNERLEQGRARLDILREQLSLSRERVDLSKSAQAAQAGRHADAATSKAVDEVQQAFGRWDAADSAVEREFGKDAIDQEEKQKQYALNRGRRVADLRKVQAADLARAYHAVNLSSQQRAEIEEAYGGIPPAPSAAAPQAPAAPAAQAPAPQQVQRDQWFRDPQTGRLKKR